MNAGAPRMMLIDSGAPKSIVSKEWIEGDLKIVKVSEEDIMKESCYRHFKMGETIYVSEVVITFPIILKTDSEDYTKRELTAYIIVADSEFLAGKRNNQGLETEDRS